MGTKYHLKHYDPAACIHEKQSKEEAFIKANGRSVLRTENSKAFRVSLSTRAYSSKKMTRGGQGSESPTRPPGAQTDASGSTPRDDTCITGQSVHVAETDSQSVHVAEIPGFQTSEPGPSHQSVNI